MLLGREIADKAVISVDNGRILGHIRDIYTDQEAGRLEGLYLGSEGLFNKTRHVIPRDAVQLLGKDVVLVHNEDVVRELAAVPQAETWLRRKDLRGRRVETSGGTRIGTIGDVVVDGGGRIIAFALDRVDVEGPLSDMPFLTREAVQDTGVESGVMTIDLAQAERDAPRFEKVPQEPGSIPLNKEATTAEGDEGARVYAG